MRHTKFAFILLAMTIGTKSFAGGEKLLFGARSAALGHASATFSDISSAFNNQAGLGFVDQAGVMSYTEQRFMLSEMTYGGLLGVLPTKSGTFALTATMFGNSNYSDTQIGIGYGRKLSDDFSFGAQIDYFQTSMIEYGSKSNITFELGLMAKLTEKVTFASHIYNPIQAQLGEFLGQPEKTPGILKAGISYLEKGKYLVTAEVEKDIDYDPFLKLGVEVYLSDKIAARGGISTGSTMYSLGLGYNAGNLKIDLSGSQHEYLGFTPSVSLTWMFKKAEVTE